MFWGSKQARFESICTIVQPILSLIKSYVPHNLAATTSSVIIVNVAATGVMGDRGPVMRMRALFVIKFILVWVGPSLLWLRSRLAIATVVHVVAVRHSGDVDDLLTMCHASTFVWVLMVFSMLSTCCALDKLPWGRVIYHGYW